MASPLAPPTENTVWSPATRVLFRFFFSYFALYLVIQDGLLHFIPGSDAASTALWWCRKELLTWVAVHVLKLSSATTAVYRAGGDSIFEFILYGFLLLVALTACLVWTVWDRKRTNYIRLNAWLRLGVCYFLIYNMLTFGINKVIPLQFVPPKLSELLTPIGLHSLRTLFWNLMGASPAYVIFAGITEVSAALLLIMNRTRTLGALVTAAVMTNVVAYNFCYDLGVKLFSSQLLLMALFLAAPSFRALTDIFIHHKPARISEHDAFESTSRPVRTAAMCAKVLLLAILVINTTAWNWKNYQRWRSFATNTPIYGIYEVESFKRNGQDIPPLATDQTRWKRVILQSPTGVLVETMTDLSLFFHAKYDASRHTISLLDQTRYVNGRALGTDKSVSGSFTYSEPDETHVTFSGQIGTDCLDIRFRRIETAGFPLLRERFSLIHSF